jgi:hypothetical protein
VAPSWNGTGSPAAIVVVVFPTFIVTGWPAGRPPRLPAV